MNIRSLKRTLLILAAIYWGFAIGIYAIAHEQFHFSSVQGTAPTLDFAIGELVDGVEVQQKMTVPADYLASVEILAGNYGRTNSGILSLSLLDASGKEVAQLDIDVSTVNNGVYTAYQLERQIATVPGQTLTLCLTTNGCESGNAITIYAGTEKSSGETSYYQFGAETMDGSLCIRLNGYDAIHFYVTYWFLMVGLFVVLFVLCVLGLRGAKQGKNNLLVALFYVYDHYTFLLKQLVMRDFKTKYKRSALGMAWSFVNPLLTMSVQYLVFSTLFKSDIPNYPVYLLTGIVFFNFFNEAVTVGMTAITGNASLIKKVYMPKYIYPVSKVISSSVNFLFALMPLFLVMIITKTNFRPSLFLLLFDILCLLAFIIGLVLLLSTAMTFFQDTQFLWGIACMMWQYMTPVFYPVSIIPKSILPYYTLNPMYQYITFARTCIIDGISPEPRSYFLCLFSAAIMLVAGISVFRKQQNKFALYL